MAQYVICPSCGKTVICGDGVCPDCGQPLDIKEIKARGLTVDYDTEKREFAAGKDYFVNTEFLSAREHFAKALAANGNSYLSQYFVLLCDIYLNEGAEKYDVMDNAVRAVLVPLELMKRSNVSAIADKLNFVIAVLNEVKIIITNRLRSHDKLFELDITEYRKKELGDLQTLLKLFKTDGETLMTYAPQVQTALGGIADYAVAVCHKAVQTIAVGEELYGPTEYEYNRFASLNGDYCYYAAQYIPDYDVKKYTPDFTQCDLLNDKVMSRFIKFDAKNKPFAKKQIIGDIVEYDDILEECGKALDFTYRNCFRSLCDKNYAKRGALLKDGLQLLYRMLTPRVVVSDDKKTEIRMGKFADVSEKCGLLSVFLTDESAFDTYARDSLKAYYEKLCDIMETHFTGEFDKYTKNVNKLKETRGEDFKRYETLLFEAAKATACALVEYVTFAAYKDKNRMKLVNYCKQAAEEFLMLHDYRVDEIDQSNVYRPILDIYNAVMREKNM